MCKSNAAVKEDRGLMWTIVIDIIGFIFYVLGTIMQRKINQWSQEHMKHNVSHVNEETFSEGLGSTR